MKKYNTNKTLIARLNRDEIPDDVLERISGYESFDDQSNGGCEVIYHVDTLRRIINEPEDDTNETTKGRIEDLYEQIKDCLYFRVATIL